MLPDGAQVPVASGNADTQTRPAEQVGGGFSRLPPQGPPCPLTGLPSQHPLPLLPELVVVLELELDDVVVPLELELDDVVVPLELELDVVVPEELLVLVEVLPPVPSDPTWTAELQPAATSSAKEVNKRRMTILLEVSRRPG